MTMVLFLRELTCHYTILSTIVPLAMQANSARLLLTLVTSVPAVLLCSIAQPVSIVPRARYVYLPVTFCSFSPLASFVFFIALQQYAPTAVNNDCISCGAGFFTGMSTAATTCTACDSGTYSWGLAVNCSICQEGRFALTRSGNCSNCGKGFIAPTPKSSSCQACFTGTYAPRIGSTFCADCPIGKSQGATGQGACEVCPAGAYMAQSGATFCTSCDAGTYQPKNGSQYCMDCTPGRYQSATAQTTCVDCEPGKALNESRGSTCTACSDISSSYAGATSCDICNKGSFLSLKKMERKQADSTVEVCVECVGDYEGINCKKAGASAQNMKLNPGYWRIAKLLNDDIEEGAKGGDSSGQRHLLRETKYNVMKYSEEIWKCPMKGPCVGGNSTQDYADGTGPYCAKGNTGPYCLLCIDNWQPDRTKLGFCIECRSISAINIIYVLIFTFLVVVIFSCILSKKIRVYSAYTPKWCLTMSAGSNRIFFYRREDAPAETIDLHASIQPTSLVMTDYCPGTIENRPGFYGSNEQRQHKKTKEKAVDLSTVGKIFFGG